MVWAIKWGEKENTTSLTPKILCKIKCTLSLQMKYHALVSCRFYKLNRRFAWRTDSDLSFNSSDCDLFNSW